MTVVNELIPGQVIDNFGVSAIFVQRADHPLYPSLQLVVWKVARNGSDYSEWSHDALSPEQDVGQARPSTNLERHWWLRRALLHESQWGPKP